MFRACISPEMTDLENSNLEYRAVGGLGVQPLGDRPIALVREAAGGDEKSSWR
jgi:hypothetical protein